MFVIPAPEVPANTNMFVGLDKAGILYPLNNNSCHSRAGGNRAWVVISYLIRGIIQRCVFIYM